jgi:Na+/pantothenate symporter
MVRFMSARSEESLVPAMTISIVVIALFDIGAVLTGMAGRALFPGLEDPEAILPLLSTELLSPGLAAVMMIVVLSAIMSTVDSLGFISAITFGRDIMAKRSGDSVKQTQMGLIVVAIGSLILAWSIPSVVNLWLTLGSVVVPGLLLPFLATFLPKVRIQKVEWMMIASAGASVIWLLLGTTDVPLFGVQPFYAGMLVSIVWTGWGLLKSGD